MPDETIIHAVGDIWFGDHPVTIGHGVRSIAERIGPGCLLDKVKKVFVDGDINFCNLETVLSDIEMHPRRLASIEMRGSPSCVEELRAGRFNVVSVANNHMMQHGRPCYEETVDVLRRSGITPIGIDECGKTNQYIHTKDGVKICLVSYSLHQEKYFKGEVPYSYRSEGSAIIEEVTALRKSFDGFLICSLHWGSEFINYPSREQILLARSLIDRGVQTVLGHHPHVLQGIERYKDGLIAYSMGNFVFDLIPKSTRDTIILRLNVLTHREFTYEAIPVVINDMYQPEIASGSAKRRIEENLVQYGRMIEQGLEMSGDEYRRHVNRELNKYRIKNYTYFLKHLHTYHPRIVLQSLARTVFSKLLLKR
ncbi:MAG: CapA family protein [Nitrospirota bacterium]